MDSKLLKINISRFESGRALAREIFIHMPTNGKMIRVVCSGDELRPALLDRLRSRGYASLYAMPIAGDSEDPESLPLYQEDSLSTPASEAISQPSNGEKPTVDSAVTMEPAPKTGDPGINFADIDELSRGTIVQISDALDEARKVLAESSEEDASNTMMSSLEILNEAVTRLKSLPEEARSETVQGLSASLDAAISKIKNFAEKEDSVKIAGLRDALSETAQKFQQADEEFSRTFSTAVKGVKSSPEANPKSQNKSLSGLAAAFHNSKIISAKNESPEKSQENILSAVSSAEEKNKFGKRNSPVQNQKNALAKNDAQLDLGAPNKAELAKQTLDSRVDSNKNESLSSEKNLSESEGEQAPLKPSETEYRFKTEKELEKDSFVIEAEKDKKLVNDTVIKGEATTKENDWAVKNLEGVAVDDLPPSSRAAANHRDLPLIAGRLATHLGHSLGYNNEGFLTDLALGAILYFSPREEIDVKNENLSCLNRAILSKKVDDLDSPMEDSLEIINFLESYFGNPECDKAKKDFSSRIFANTLAELHRSSGNLNPWNEARWSQFVEKGPSAESYSLCSKACAKANRAFKEITR